MALDQETNNAHASGRAPRPSHQKAVICVFCGASPGLSPTHLEAARSLAQAFHKHNINLVYGGGTVGIMGQVARELVALSGPDSVHGIIPSALIKYEQGPHKTPASNAAAMKKSPSVVEEKLQNGEPTIDAAVYGRTTVVKDMHTRKQLMAREVLRGGPGSGFVALSGGYGTLEELMEVTTWNQLGIHDRGIVVFNVDGYWDGLLAWVRNAVDSGFISGSNGAILSEAKDAEGVVKALREYTNSEGKLNLNWDQEG